MAKSSTKSDTKKDDAKKWLGRNSRPPEIPGDIFAPHSMGMALVRPRSSW